MLYAKTNQAFYTGWFLPENPHSVISVVLDELIKYIAFWKIPKLYKTSHDSPKTAESEKELVHVNPESNSR